jgi:DNA helicase II / ATP-dependent DNA helicase PcrA
MTLKHQEAAEAGFQAAYQALNLAQRQAVDTIDGPVMVIAGPGTGKTQILTLRIANILRQTDTAPESILALTFTESGVVAMRERLTRYLGARAYEVPIHTFHGFCGEIIRRYPEAFDTLIGSTPAADLDKITMVQSILTDTSLKRLRPTGDPTYYVRAIITVISEMKREYVSPDDLRVIITSQEMLLQGIEQYHTKGAHKGKERGEYRTLREQIEKNLELCFVYRQYETMLRTQRLHDFEDMIIETVRVLANNEDVRLDVQERYQYVLADEHQDVNGSQNRILELLCNYHERPNIFVVGDEKQAIYRFQGASLENFLYFEDQFQGTTMISLTENYRSTQPILDLAHRFIAVEEGPLKDLRIALTSNRGKEAALTTANFQHEAVEDAGLVAAIKNLIGTGVRLTEIAVIVRSNREVERLAHVLASASIPTEASSDANIIDHPFLPYFMVRTGELTRVT